MLTTTNRPQLIPANRMTYVAAELVDHMLNNRFVHLVNDSEEVAGHIRSLAFEGGPRWLVVGVMTEDGLTSICVRVHA